MNINTMNNRKFYGFFERRIYELSACDQEEPNLLVMLRNYSEGQRRVVQNYRIVKTSAMS